MADKNPLRADAQRNRERILAAAEEVFLEKGAGVSLDDVAKRAGVGIGTLYRRFPTREELLATAYSARFLALAQSSSARDANLDPVSSLRIFLESLVQYTNLYRGFATVLGTVLQLGTAGCRATSAEGARLLQNAQKFGAVRSDISFNDIVCIATAISLATQHERSPRLHISRLVNVFLNGMVQFK